jgi:protein-tyrosine phosphatase
MNEGTFSVLFVCTGNICRSPLAEQIFRHQLADHSGVVVASSAGTAASTGTTMTEQAARLSLRYGGQPSAHRASLVSAEKVRNSNLVLTASREHRAAVVSLVPRASRTTFTIREFARLLQTLRELEPDTLTALETPGAAGLDALVEATSRMRGFSRRLASSEDYDVVDPYRRPQEIYDIAGSLINDSISVITAGLGTILDSQASGAPFGSTDEIVGSEQLRGKDD